MTIVWCLFVGNLSLFFNKMLARVGSIFKAHIWPCVLVFVYRAPSGGCPGTWVMTNFVFLSASALPPCDPPKDVTQMISFSFVGITIQNYICSWICFRILLYTLKYVQILLYTFIHLHRLQSIIFFTKIRPDVRPNQCHNSDPRASPRAGIWHPPSYHIPKGFSISKEPHFKVKSNVLNGFWGFIKVQNSNNRGSV
jgi:hypothetical protein